MNKPWDPGICELSEERLQTIIQSTPGDFGIYLLEPGSMKALYLSAGMPQITGISLEDRAAVPDGNLLNVVFESDRPYLLRLMESARQGITGGGCYYRVHNKETGYVWLHMKARLIGLYHNVPAMLGVVVNSTLEAQSQAGLIAHFNSIVAVIDLKTDEILFANDAAEDLWKTGMPYSGGPCWAFASGRSSRCEWCPLHRLENRDTLEEDVHDTVHERWFRVNGERMDWYGREAAALFLTDITAHHQAYQQLQADNRVLQETIDGIPAGIAVYEKKNGLIRRIGVNRYLCQIKGMTREQLIAEDFAGIFVRVMPEFMPMVKDDLVHVFRDGRSDAVYQTRNIQTGESVWIHRRGTAVLQEDGSQLGFFSYHDITAEKRTEEELRMNRQIYQLAARGADLAVWEYDIASRTLTSLIRNRHSHDSANAVRVFTDVPESVLGKYKPSEHAAILEMYRKIVEGAPLVTGEFWQLPRDGMPPVCEKITYSVFYDEIGRPVKAYGIGQDVTAAKIAERKYEGIYQDMLKMNPNAIGSFRLNVSQGTVSDLETSQEYYKPMIRSRSFDQLAENMAGRIASDREREAFAGTFSRENMMAVFLNGSNRLEATARGYVTEDTIHWLTLYVHMTQNPATQDIEAVCCIIDCDETKLGEQIIGTLTEGEYDFLAVANPKTGRFEYFSVPDNGSYRLVSANSRYQDVLRMSFGSADPGDLKGYEKAGSLERVISQLELRQNYSFVVRQNGAEGIRKKYSYCWLGDTREKILVTRSDVTDIVREEQERARQLQKAVDQAREADRLKTEFLGNVSHDMRTPMNGVIGYTELALKSSDPQEMREYLEKIRLSGETLLMLINDTLDLSRMETGRISMHAEPLLLSSLVQSDITILEPTLQARNIHLTLDAERSETPVLSDSLCLKKIAINILSNAVKFTPEGGSIQVVCRQHPLADGSIDAVLTVQDSGCGISKSFLPRVFEPFAQERLAGSAGIGGSGLGLAIVKRLVEKLGGTVRVDSELGKGTRVEVNIRFQPALQGVPAEEAEPENPHAGLAGRRVLLVEDNRVNMEIARKLLSVKGVIVDCAKDGAEGVQKFSAAPVNTYDAVLMDIRMPVMDGYEAARQIRALKRRDADTAIIAMTADAYQSDVEKAKAAGMNAHLPKPIEPQRLYDTLEQYCRKR